MAAATTFAEHLRNLSPEEMHSALGQFLPKDATTEQKVQLVAMGLRSPEGPALRQELGRWIVDRLVPVASLLPNRYEMWRGPTRECMLFVISQLSVDRLAPKLVEQYELPLNTSPEVRLLKLISRVPGLQKLGQVLARNRHLRHSVRTALSKLENGIRDVSMPEMLTVLHHELGERMELFDVKIERKLLSEASVSAVVRFSWWNAEKHRREKGVLKVLKPHIPDCFAEDMKILQELADYFGQRAHKGFSSGVIPDTFSKIRRHLQREVDFPGEQSALLEAAKQFKSVRRVRVPQLIPHFCTARVTAMSEEEGIKVTSAALHLDGERRAELSKHLVEALVAFPLLSRSPYALFHADPHAGNLLYNRRTGELILLDWALAERLTREQRRRLTLMFGAVAFRNPAAACEQIRHLSERDGKNRPGDVRTIKTTVEKFFRELPVTKLPRAVDAMSLLESAAMAGIRFPASLIMFSKVLFTLDGILDDIRGGGATAEFTIARYLLKRWVRQPFTIGLPLTVRDWIGLECSALLYGGRLGVRWEETLSTRMFSSKPGVKISRAAGDGTRY